MHTLLGMSEELRFNFCLVNYYRNGDDYISWHGDDMTDLQVGAPIVSVSIGATRDFKIRPKKQYRDILGNETLTIDLRDGDILVMAGKLQAYYEHHVPKRKRVTTGRLNYTFRVVRL